MIRMERRHKAKMMPQGRLSDPAALCISVYIYNNFALCLHDFDISGALAFLFLALFVDRICCLARMI